MAIFKCKMCGGSLDISDGVSVATCEYCGTKQTVSKSKDEVVANLFNRANNLRLKCEFDKAAQIYEKIVEQDDSEAEAHWGIVLCKYGIEYVEDPKTLKRIPTCHRTLFDAVTTDADYLAAIDYSDAAQQVIYENEARAIDKMQRDILGIVKNEKPFDVFICYKETDANGKRTIDSTIANDIYYQLTNEGFKVFYAAITLEDKLGQEYEPYIFAALNSSKVMLVLGTKPEYFSAVWVKNEWSRFMQLMKSDRSKLLIPCYKDMAAYELPEEFAHLQAQDISKIGFINDVVRGIKKVLKSTESTKPVVKETVVTGGNTAPLLKRAFMFLEDGDFDSANEYCEKVLDLDPECALAYLGELMAELQVKNQESLKDYPEPFDDRNNYQKAVRFADNKLKTFLKDKTQYINERNENIRVQNTYDLANSHLSLSEEEATLIKAVEMFESIKGFKDSKEKIPLCKKRIEEIKANEEARRLENERKAEKRKKIIKKVAILGSLAVCAIVIVTTALVDSIISYQNKENLKNAKFGDYVFFGAYEQDNIKINGKEDIEWLVLEREDNKVLLISKYALDCQPYNTTLIDATWDNSYIRSWLNGDFYNAAFNVSEKEGIQVTMIEAEKQYISGAPIAKSCNDKIFLLSEYEAKKYFSYNDARKAKATKYAKEQGAYTSNEYCWWWLRSPAPYGSGQAQGVFPIGNINENGYEVTKTSYCSVRPAMWIDISEL